MKKILFIAPLLFFSCKKLPKQYKFSIFNNSGKYLEVYAPDFDPEIYKMHNGRTNLFVAIEGVYKIQVKSIDDSLTNYQQVINLNEDYIEIKLHK